MKALYLEFELVCIECNEKFVSRWRKKSMSGYREAKYCPQCAGRRGKMAYSGVGFYTSSHDGYSYRFLNGKWTAEHRCVMAQHLGRALRKGECVHHKDGDRSNNDLDNLELWVRPHISGVRAVDLICPHCDKPYY